MIEITHTDPWVVVSKGEKNLVTLNHGEQHELLEALARVHGFSLIDREQRKSLVELAGEADEDDNDYDHATDAWSTWQDRCEALSSAVLSALSTEEV